VGLKRRGIPANAMPSSSPFLFLSLDYSASPAVRPDTRAALRHIHGAAPRSHPSVTHPNRSHVPLTAMIVAPISGPVTGVAIGKTSNVPLFPTISRDGRAAAKLRFPKSRI